MGNASGFLSSCSTFFPGCQIFRRGKCGVRKKTKTRTPLNYDAEMFHASTSLIMTDIFSDVRSQEVFSKISL